VTSRARSACRMVPVSVGAARMAESAGTAAMPMRAEAMAATPPLLRRVPLTRCRSPRLTSLRCPSLGIPPSIGLTSVWLSILPAGKRLPGTSRVDGRCLPVPVRAASPMKL
jgi:hypothetical protein